MTNVFKNYSLPDQSPDVIIIKKGDLGGYVIEALYGSERKTAGFSGVNALASIVPAMLLGRGILETLASAQEQINKVKEETKVDPAPEAVSKPAPKAKAAKVKAKAKAKADPTSGTAKRRGRPPLSAEEKARRAAERKAKMNGQEAALAA